MVIRRSLPDVAGRDRNTLSLSDKLAISNEHINNREYIGTKTIDHRQYLTCRPVDHWHVHFRKTRRIPVTCTFVCRNSAVYRRDLDNKYMQHRQVIMFIFKLKNRHRTDQDHVEQDCRAYEMPYDCMSMIQWQRHTHNAFRFHRQHCHLFVATMVHRVYLLNVRVHCKILMHR
jgi:hypothetical protein